MGKVFEIIDGDISDGYHTFEEMYDHRHSLYLALIKMAINLNLKVYYKPDHFQGYDAVYLELPQGQISYHLPSGFRGILDRLKIPVVTVDCYDGHTGKDVLERLSEFFCNVKNTDKEMLL